MSTIKLKRSAVAGKQPNTSILDLGEIAINTHDGKLFFKKDDGSASIVTIQEVTEDNLAIDSSALTNVTANTLAGALSDLDSALTAGGLTFVSVDSTLNGDGTVGSPLSVANNEHYHYSNTILDFDSTVNTAIYNTVDKTFVDALNVDADTLDGANSDFFLDYINFTNTPTIPQANIDFDPVGTDNSTDVTLAGSYDYLTISGQQITLNQIDYTTDISNLPTLYTTADANTDIDARVTKTFVDNLGVDAATLDGANGTYYLDWTNTTNKPDPNIEVVLSGDVTGSANVTLTDLANGQIAITAAVTDDSHNHIISNIDGLQTDLDAKVDLAGDTMTGFLTLHADPTQNLHAATKGYVDEVATGLQVKGSVEAATNTAITATYDNGNNGIGSTLTIANTATLDIDGWTSWSEFDGVLIKDQSNAFENGRYYVSTVGNTSVDWVLTRCGACDEPEEIIGAFVFVVHGNTYESTGWAATVANVDSFAVGTDDITWTQFSGPGTYLAGTDLTLSGTTFNLNSTIAANTTGTANNSTNLNGQAASYYLDFDNFTNIPDPVITLDGDLTGSVTLTNLANGTLTATVSDNSHNHTVSNISDFTAGANTAIDNRVTQSFVNALNVDADTLDGNDSTYFTNASNLSSGTVPTARLGTGTANSTTYLAGDQTWKEISGGGGTTWVVKTANYTAVTGDGIIADTSNGAFTITLPATPSTGDNVIIADGNDWSNTNLTVARNGSTIEGLSEDLTLDVGSIQVHLIYDGATWEVYAFTGPATTIQADDTSTDATKYITWSDTTSGVYNAKVSSTKLYFNPSSGTLNATDFNSLSDSRLKENVKDLEVDYDMLMNIRSVSFDWKDNGKSAYGFIAQELEEIMPELIAENKDTSYKSVSYTQLIPHLLEAIKDLKRQVDELKERK